MVGVRISRSLAPENEVALDIVIFFQLVVLGVIFLVSVYNNLEMPEFSAGLLGLMGISSGTYLGFKVPENAAPAGNRPSHFTGVSTSLTSPARDTRRAGNLESRNQPAFHPPGDPHPAACHPTNSFPAAPIRLVDFVPFESSVHTSCGSCNLFLA